MGRLEVIMGFPIFDLSLLAFGPSGGREDRFCCEVYRNAIRAL